jgi:hypothetical protein
MDFIGARSIEMLISYHSAGLGIFPGGTPQGQPESVRLAKGIAAITDYAYPPQPTECEYTGTLADFAVYNGVAAAVDLELNSPTDPELETNMKVLNLLLDWDLPTPTPVGTLGATFTSTPRPRYTRTPSATPSPTATRTARASATGAPAATPTR